MEPIVYIGNKFMEIINSIGERLREVREGMGMTQSDFADIAAAAGVPGATRQSQAKYEKGVASPSAAYMAAMAATGADVLYILTGQRSQPVPAEALLPPDERIMLDNFRHAPKAVQSGIKTTLGAFAPGRGAGRKAG